MVVCEKCFAEIRGDRKKRDLFFCECCGRPDNLVFFTVKPEDMTDPLFQELMERGKLKNVVA